MAKKTVFAADEHLIVYGDFTVRGNTVFLNTVETQNQSNQYIINSDADASSATLRFLANASANVDLVHDGTGNLLVHPGLQGNVYIPAGNVLTVDGTLSGAALANTTISSANTLSNPRAFSISGDVAAPAINFDGSSDVALVATIEKDATITLQGAVTGSGTMTNLGNTTITTVVDSLGIDYVRDVLPGNGLSKSSTLSEAQNVSLAVGAGDGITVDATTVAVDSTVVRTNNTQSISGDKTYTGNIDMTAAVLTAATLAQGAGSQRVATTQYVDTAISNLLDGAPNQLDTLNELAAALNDNANYASTINTALAGKADANLVLTAGDGLSGGGNLSAGRSFAVDSTVVRTTGNQSIAGTKTFTGELVIPAASSTTANVIYTRNDRVFAYVGSTEVELTPALDVGQIEDVGSTGINILAGSRVDTVANSNITVYGVRSITADTGLTIAESSNVITLSGRSNANIWGLFSVTNSSGFGNLAYNSTTGVITYVGTSSGDIRGLFSGVGLIGYNSSTGAISTSADNYDRWRYVTDTANVQDVASGNQIEFRGGAGIDVTHSGNIITVASSTGGDITEVTAGDGLSGGGASGAVTLDVDSTVARTNVSETFDQDVVVQGNLTVNGTTFIVNSETLTIDDNIIVLNNNETGAPSQDAGIEIERGTSTNVQLIWDEASDAWQFTNDGSTYHPIPTSTTDLSEGTNLYYTDARARAAVSAEGDLAYNSTTGVFSFTERTDSEVRALFSATGDLSYNSASGQFSFNETYSTANELLAALLTVDGSTSGLDADTLDGQEGTYYLSLSNATGSTDDISEGNINLYYTTTRANSAVDARVNKDFIDALNVDAGTLDGQSRSASRSNNTVVSRNAGGDIFVDDVHAYRGDGTGAIYLGDTSHYLFFDGTGYSMPSGSLNVGGNVDATFFNGTATSAQYADLAENYVADADYEPGTVLIFGGEHEVTTTNQSLDHRVAGVVSTAPAHLMNSHCEGEYVVPLALKGRVPVKVVGTVKPGDLLATSTRPGYARAVSRGEAKGFDVIAKAIGHSQDGWVEALVI